MLPRSQSIFHLGEEGGSAQYQRRSLLGTAMSGADSRRARERERLVVGLQILVHHQYHHHGRQAHAQAQAANVVLKQMVRPPPPPPRASAAVVSCSFLETCSLCQRELSPNKDVYMYRGDQGFCSEECRWKQILVDEARERQAIGKEQRRGLAHHHTAPIRSRPRKTTLLAVA